jgi:hypothetical protein
MLVRGAILKIHIFMAKAIPVDVGIVNPNVGWLGDKALTTKSPSRIHQNIFRIDRAGALGGKPLGEPLDGWKPGAKSSAVEGDA